VQAHRIRRDPPGQRPAAVRPLSRASRPPRREADDDDEFDFEPIAPVAAPPVRARARAVEEVDDRPSDRRRVFSALLSSVVPGTGQLVNTRWRAAVQFALPTLALAGIAVLVAKLVPLPQLLALALAPTTIVALLILNAIVFGWRVLAAGQAFFDRRFDWRPRPAAGAGLAAILVITAIPHLFAASIGLGAMNAFSSIFSTASVTGGVSGARSGPVPVPGGRINVLLVGVDSGTGRDHALSDTMMVISVDPVGKTVSMVSVPRDMVGAPLAAGGTYAPKLNSLMSFAQRNPKQFPEGGMRTLEDTIGLILGIPINYYVTADLASFESLVDALGGIDINVAKALDDPTYHGYGVKMGWSVTAGPHHFDGSDALAYARIRHPAGESDFTRQARQQALLIALRHQLASPDLVLRLPSLISIVGKDIETDLPRDQLPNLAAVASEITSKSIFQLVVRYPMVRPGSISPYGSVQIPDLAKIQAAAALLFTAPGVKPSVSGATSAKPAPSDPGSSSAP
jgi:polyisoprenyl-teichoic acid--peptidoglycan teichoic acid transferase